MCGSKYPFSAFQMGRMSEETCFINTVLLFCCTTKLIEIPGKKKKNTIFLVSMSQSVGMLRETYSHGKSDIKENDTI